MVLNLTSLLIVKRQRARDTDYRSYIAYFKIKISWDDSQVASTKLVASNIHYNTVPANDILASLAYTVS